MVILRNRYGGAMESMVWALVPDSSVTDSSGRVQDTMSMRERRDDECVALYRQGDMRAFEELVRRYQVTPASVRDGEVVDDILDPDSTASEVWADSAYRSAEIEAKLAEMERDQRRPPLP
mgnify:CR=1 FL=1